MMELLVELDQMEETRDLLAQASFDQEVDASIGLEDEDDDEEGDTVLALDKESD
jgi:hypothetical protein